MSEDGPNPAEDDFEDLENQLKKLVPLNLESEFLGALTADQQRIEAAGNGRRKKRLTMALVVTACLALLLTNILHWTGLWGASNELERNTAEGSIEAGELDSLVADSRTKRSNIRFQPVSSEGFLIDASSGRVIESEGGRLQRQVELEFQDVDHWHDPSTATNIRIYSPRREVIRVPLRTD